MKRKYMLSAVIFTKKIQTDPFITIPIATRRGGGQKQARQASSTACGLLRPLWPQRRKCQGTRLKCLGHLGVPLFQNPQQLPTTPLCCSGGGKSFVRVARLPQASGRQAHLPGRHQAQTPDALPLSCHLCCCTARIGEGRGAGKEEGEAAPGRSARACLPVVTTVQARGT